MTIKEIVYLIIINIVDNTIVYIIKYITISIFKIIYTNL